MLSASVPLLFSLSSHLPAPTRTSSALAFFREAFSPLVSPTSFFTLAVCLGGTAGGGKRERREEGEVEGGGGGREVGGQSAGSEGGRALWPRGSAISRRQGTHW